MNIDIVEDDFLYLHMEKIERKILDNLPKERELSHSFTKVFERKINRLIKKEKYLGVMRIFSNHMKKVAVIFIVIVSLLFATMMSVKAYRTKFIEVITEIWQEFTSIIYSDKENVDTNILVPVNPGYVPEGYNIFEQQILEYLHYIIYRNNVNQEIYYEQILLSQGKVLVDTENTEVEEIEIGMYIVTIFSNKGLHQIYWNDDLYVYAIISEIDKQEIIKIAESIIEK